MRSKVLTFLALCAGILLILCGCKADKQETDLAEAKVSATETVSEATPLYTAAAVEITEAETESYANAELDTKANTSAVSEEAVSISLTPNGGIILPDDEW